jgi:hypothetical protein
MAITKRNLYLPDRNLANLTVNVDDNRLGLDTSEISVDFTTSPATVTVKQGSIIEVNGNSYSITGTDYVFQMANASHNYITFTDDPAVGFSSAANVGNFNAQKQGFYQTGNLIRTLGYYIAQTDKRVIENKRYRSLISAWSNTVNPSIAPGITTGIGFATSRYDFLAEMSAGAFIALYSGLYDLQLTITIITTARVYGTIFMTRTGPVQEQLIYVDQVAGTRAYSFRKLVSLQAGNTVGFTVLNNAGSSSNLIIDAAQNQSFLEILGVK